MTRRPPIPWKVAGLVAWAALTRQQRSNREDCILSLGSLRPPPLLIDAANLPAQGPCLVTCNHYTSPGLPAWWIPIAISVVAPYEIHWLVSAMWTFQHLGGWRALAVGSISRPVTRLLFRRLAAVYGHTPSPPMPPEAEDAERRAAAVRRVLAYARNTPQAVVGIAPEGRDFPGGVLGEAPPGVGRFIALLNSHLRQIIPVGCYQEDDRLVVRFGASYQLPAISGSPQQRDQQTSQIVMQAIARLLPAHLRGEWDK